MLHLLFAYLLPLPDLLLLLGKPGESPARRLLRWALECGFETRSDGRAARLVVRVLGLGVVIEAGLPPALSAANGPGQPGEPDNDGVDGEGSDLDARRRALARFFAREIGQQIAEKLAQNAEKGANFDEISVKIDQIVQKNGENGMLFTLGRDAVQSAWADRLMRTDTRIMMVIGNLHGYDRAARSFRLPAKVEQHRIARLSIGDQVVFGTPAEHMTVTISGLRAEDDGGTVYYAA